jgi:hypothetical protein
MIRDFWQGATESAQQCAAVCFGSAALAFGLSFLVEPGQVHPDFYSVLATTIPVLLFALLVRLSSVRDLAAELFAEIREDERQIEELRRTAPPEGTTAPARLDELLVDRKKSAEALEEAGPRMLAALLAAFFVAALAEVACLVALAMNESTEAAFYASSVGTAIVAFLIANNEIGNFRLSFSRSGLLLPSQAKERIER